MPGNTQEIAMTTNNTVVEDGAEEIAERCAQFAAQIAAGDMRATAATNAAKAAMERLLRLAETRRSGQIEHIALFLGAVWNGRRHFDLYSLRCLDTVIADDMLTVLDGLRWAQVAIGAMAGEGDARIEAVLRSWGMFGVDQVGQFIAVRD
jgi:hypothetical protein